RRAGNALEAHAPPAVPVPAHRRDGRWRRGLRPRCRLTGRLGVSVPDDERQASAHRLLQPRFHGQRPVPERRGVLGVRGSADHRHAGDGGLAMLLGELITLTQNKLPVKTVVYNNSSLNFVELEMKAAGFVTFGTDLANPDFSTIAEAVGIKGFRVEKSKDLPKVVKEFLAYD